MNNSTQTTPTAASAESTPTPWFMHEYAGEKHGTPLYSIGSDAYRFPDGSHIAIAANIGEEQDRAALSAAKA